MCFTAMLSFKYIFKNYLQLLFSLRRCLSQKFGFSYKHTSPFMAMQRWYALVELRVFSCICIMVVEKMKIIYAKMDSAWVLLVRLFYVLFCFCNENPEGYYVQELVGYCSRDLGFT